MRVTQFIIYLLFFFSIVVLAALSFVFLQRYSSYIHYTADVEKTYRVITEITQLESLLKDTETGNRGYILMQDSSFLEPLLLAEKEIKIAIKDVGKLISD